jgi:hypothetical protein
MYSITSELAQRRHFYVYELCLLYVKKAVILWRKYIYKKNNFEQRIKWGEKQQKYNTVETVPKSNRKTVEIGKNNTPTT